METYPSSETSQVPFVESNWEKKGTVDPATEVKKNGDDDKNNKIKNNDNNNITIIIIMIII